MGEITSIGRVRLAVESTFGGDLTGDMNNFFSIRTDAGRWKASGPKRARITVDPLRSFRNQKYPNERGFKNGQLETGGQLCSVGTEIANGVTTTKDGISKLFESILGGYRTGQGSVVATFNSTTEIIVDSGDGAQMLAAQLLFVETAVGSGLYVPTFAQSRSTDTLTLGVALPAGAGAVGCKVLNVQMVYETDKPVGTVQWLAELTRDRDRIMLYAGCFGTLGLEWPLGDAVKWSTTQQTTTWFHDDELATPQGGSGLSIGYAYDAGTPVIGRGNSIHFGPANSTTRVTPTVLEFTIDLGIAQTPIPSHNGVDGRAGYEANPGETTATITVLAGTETYKDAHEAGTEYRVLAQAGNLGGKQIALHLPRVQITDIEETEMNGLDVEKLTLLCLPANGFADQATDVLRSRLYLGRG